MSMSQCGEICKTPPKCIRKERGRDFYYCCSIVAATGAMSWRRCVLLWKRNYFVWASKTCFYNTVPEQFNPNISVCSAFYGDYFLKLGVACQLCSKASIKWGNPNFARTVWRFWLTACKHYKLKEFANDYSNASFELCRVVLVVCRFSDHKCRHGNV